MMKPGTPSWYRSRAATARTMAEGFSDPVARKTMAVVAQNFDRIAFSRVHDGALKRIRVIQEGNNFYRVLDNGGGGASMLARYPFPVHEWDFKGGAAARIWFEAWCAERDYEPVYVT